MKGKNIIILVILFTMPFQTYCMNIQDIDSVVILQAPWHIITPADISCSNFEYDMSYKEYHISDSTTIFDIVRELSCLKAAKVKSLDVRCKINFYSYGKVCVSACMDSRHVLYDGTLYEKSQSFIGLIDWVEKINKPKEPASRCRHSKRDIPFPNGRDSLYSYLSMKLEGVLNAITEPMIMIVDCQIDKSGNTMNVIIRNEKNMKLSDNSIKIISKIRALFMKEIKWIPDKERFPFDVVTIPLSFYVQ